MISILLIKEIKSALSTFIFQFVTVLSVIVCSAYVLIGISNYEDRQKTYENIVSGNTDHINDVNVFSSLKPKVAIEPNVLSCFCTGVSKEIGAFTEVTHHEIPTSLKSGLLQNNFIVSRFNFDFNQTIIVLLSLLALLLSFNAISKEYEQNTLKLLFSNGISRRKVLGAKILTCQIIISLTLLIIFIVALIIILLTPSIAFNFKLFSQLLLLFFLYEVYILFFVLLGCLFSVLVKKSSVSLILCLFVWLLTIIVIPNSSVFISESFYNKSLSRNFEMDKEQKELEAQKSLHEWDKENPVPGREYRYGYVNFNYQTNAFLARGVHPVYIEWCEKYFSHMNKVQLDLARHNYNYTSEKIRIKEKQLKISNILSYLSVSHIINSIIENLSYTSWNYHNHFLNEVKDYRKLVINYVESKNGYSGRRWFTDDPINEQPWVLDPENFDINRLNNDIRIKVLAYKCAKIYNNLPSRKLNLNDFPVFVQPKISFSELIGSIIVPSIIILIYCGILIYIVFHAFNKYNTIS